MINIGVIGEYLITTGSSLGCLMKRTLLFFSLVCLLVHIIVMPTPALCAGFRDAVRSFSTQAKDSVGEIRGKVQERVQDVREKAHDKYEQQKEQAAGTAETMEGTALSI